MKKRLTDWFSSSINPTLCGWYNVKCANHKTRFESLSGRDGGVSGMRYWNGSKWLFKPGGRASNFGEVGWVNDYWRGLVEPPTSSKDAAKAVRRESKP
jgi:hypothetical protein